MCQVYIIDDDPTYLTVTESLIKQHGVFETYRSYANPVNALIDIFEAYYTSKKLPEIILLDLFMPKLTGWNFLDSFNSIATLDNTTAVYIVTSSVNPDDKQRAQLYSCVKGFLSKPASFDMLQEMQVS
jgi:CheY-like chemotaxis protein